MSCVWTYGHRSIAVGLIFCLNICIQMRVQEDKPSEFARVPKWRNTVRTVVSSEVLFIVPPVTVPSTLTPNANLVGLARTMKIRLATLLTSLVVSFSSSGGEEVLEKECELLGYGESLRCSTCKHFEEIIADPGTIGTYESLILGLY